MGLRAISFPRNPGRSIKDHRVAKTKAFGQRIRSAKEGMGYVGANASTCANRPKVCGMLAQVPQSHD
jgi:hypothetical protein